MLVEIVHESGKRYTIPVSQVVVATNDGDACAITYEHAGIIIHTDTQHKDFANTCSQLKVKNIKVES